VLDLARRGHRRDSEGRFWHPGGVFEHFTDGARRILVLAHGEAQGLHAGSIGPEHLFLGMLREPEGIAGNALLDAGADYGRARALLEEHKREQTGRGSDREPFSRGTIRVMERSLQISWAQADAGIDTEHLLVALLEQNDDATEAVLAGLDVTPKEVTQRVEALLAERNRNR
jgi:ATP-dependent Clp protease ATP-binding subunit ClpC